jgi:small subunit ribosomal protein S2
MLTNYQTISGRLARLRELREMERSGAFEFLPKKEVLRLRHEKEKLERNLGGVQDMERLPDAIFVIDTKKEHIAVTEARKLGLPVIAIVDTNCDPDEVDYIIPGNDDAIRAVSLITRVMADALEEGQSEGWQEFAARSVGPDEAGPGQEAEPEIEREPAAAPPGETAEAGAAAAPSETAEASPAASTGEATEARSDAGPREVAAGE